MGNVSAKQLRPRYDAATSPGPGGAVFLHHSAEARKSSSGSSSDSSSQDFLDAESDFHSSSTDEEERDFEDLLSRTHEGLLSCTHEEIITRAHEDAFMKAVLSFCAHMGGRMDNLDNARLYDEFCSYAASHRPNMGVV